MRIKRIIHRGYKEFLETKRKGLKIPQVFGKYQYIFSNSRGKISLIKQIRSYNHHPNFWEIFCLKGDLFKDTEKFKYKVDAVTRVKEYLGVDDLSELVSKKLDKIKNEKHKRNKTEDN